MVDARGTTLMVQLTALRTEWLPQMHAAHVEMATRYGGPRPLLALVKLDKRFPLDIGFDQNLGELRRELELARPYFAACAVVVSFGGMLGTTMRQALRFIGLLAHGSPPMQVCSTAAEAVMWIEPYAMSCTGCAFNRVDCLEALREVEALLGCTD